MMAEPARNIAADIHKIRSGARWIKYERAEQILQTLEDLLATPQYHRMPNLIISGPTNNGKTSIIDRFSSRHPADLHLASQASNVPVFVYEMPETPDASTFYNDVLEELLIPSRSSAPLDQRRRRVKHELERYQVRMLIFDELQHLTGMAVQKQRQFLNMLKHLGNELMIPIVVVGTREAFNVIQSDRHLSNRFEPALLPRWQLGDEYFNLLGSFETILPIDCIGQLTNDDIAFAIREKSEGTIGEIAHLLAKATEHMIKTGAHRIDRRVLDRCGYISPSIRNKADDGIF
jgi:hypothetical protein